MGAASCKAKHCPAYDDTMEGYKEPKKKKKRKEGLFDKKMRFPTAYLEHSESIYI